MTEKVATDMKAAWARASLAIAAARARGDGVLVQWIDRGRKPEYPPDPAYPKGRDVDISVARDGSKAARSCDIHLPFYPAPRCGYVVVTCIECDQTVLLTVAGRPDDPRTVRLSCDKGRQPLASRMVQP